MLGGVGMGLGIRRVACAGLEMCSGFPPMLDQLPPRLAPEAPGGAWPCGTTGSPPPPYVTSNPSAATRWYITSKPPIRSFLAIALLRLANDGSGSITAPSRSEYRCWTCSARGSPPSIS